MSVWHEAAELIATGKEVYSCHAIHRAANPNVPTYQLWATYSDEPLVQRYTAMFSPNGDAHNPDAWLSSYDGDRKNINLRVLALCFAHEVFK